MRIPWIIVQHQACLSPQRSRHQESRLQNSLPAVPSHHPQKRASLLKSTNVPTARAMILQKNEHS